MTLVWEFSRAAMVLTAPSLALSVFADPVEDPVGVQVGVEITPLDCVDSCGPSAGGGTGGEQIATTGADFPVATVVVAVLTVIFGAAITVVARRRRLLTAASVARPAQGGTAPSGPENHSR